MKQLVSFLLDIKDVKKQKSEKKLIRVITFCINNIFCSVVSLAKLEISMNESTNAGGCVDRVSCFYWMQFKKQKNDIEVRALVYTRHFSTDFSTTLYTFVS